MRSEKGWILAPPLPVTQVHCMHLSLPGLPLPSHQVLNECLKPWLSISATVSYIFQLFHQFVLEELKATKPVFLLKVNIYWCFRMTCSCINRMLSKNHKIGEVTRYQILLQYIEILNLWSRVQNNLYQRDSYIYCGYRSVDWKILRNMIRLHEMDWHAFLKKREKMTS